MADQRMVGDILSERRRSLGLSIDRVVADTKLQRRMVDAFEDSDFDAMPPKGYAQASLASYARYLGLNPNEILRIYDDQLYEHQRMIDAADRGGVRRDGEAGRRGRSQRQVRERDYDAESSARSGSVRRSDSYRSGSRDTSRGGSHDAYEAPRGRVSERPYDRGLYDSGYRRGDGSGRQASGRSDAFYGDSYDRRSSGRYPDEGRRPQRSSSTRESREYPDRSRQARGIQREAPHGRVTQVVTLDDGYQGGSGGPEAHNSDTYHPRPARSTVGERQSFSEVVQGFLNSIRSDRRTFLVIVGVVALTLVVILAVAVSSCVRDRGSDGGTPTIPVTSMQDAQAGSGTDAAGSASSTPLAPSIDLAKLAPGTTVALAVNADATTSPWIEASVDGVGVYAAITAPGTNLQWTLNQNAVIKLSSIDGVSIYVNGTSVTPTYQNATYELDLSVDPALIPQQTPEGGDGTVPEGGDDAAGDEPVE